MTLFAKESVIAPRIVAERRNNNNRGLKPTAILNGREATLLAAWLN